MTKKDTQKKDNEIVDLDGGLFYLGYFSKVCTFCKHYNPDSRDEDKEIIGTCKAFPKGIPHKIWLGKNDHTKPYRGDHGIRFEPFKENKDS